MADVTQYIGARYVPIFGRIGEDSIEWDNSKEYEPLTIVSHAGNSYTSRQYVPIGIDISNNAFWALTGNYNAQVEQYRRETAAHDSRITANAQAIAAETTRATNAEKASADAITALGTVIPASDFSEENTVKKYVDYQDEKIMDAITALSNNYLPFKFDYVDYTGRNGNITKVYYAIVPKNFKPILQLANDTVDTVQYEIDNAYDNDSSLLVNAGTFNTDTGITEGIVIANGVVRKTTPTSLSDRTILYMNENGELGSVPSDTSAQTLLEDFHAVWAVTGFYPFIINGAFTQSGRSETDYQPRTCIAQDNDGAYCVFACSGRKRENVGLTIFDMYDFLSYIGFDARFAYNLDGGASSSLSVMGARINMLTDNTHRKVANFLAFKTTDKVNKNIFYATRALSDFILRNSKEKRTLYGSEFTQYVKDGNNTVEAIVNVDTTDSDYKYTTMLSRNFQQSNGLYRLLLKKTGDADYSTAISANTQYQLIKFFGKTPVMQEIVSYLNWSAHAKNTQHTLLDSTPMMKYLAIFQQSNNNFVVPFYRYNFDTTPGEPTYAYAVAPNGDNTKFTLTFDFAANTVSFTYDGTSTTIFLMRLIGLDWIF